jgi:flavin reductase (DIM6/NTAB) family NADH-FMN oxidoreductase RutF
MIAAGMDFLPVDINCYFVPATGDRDRICRQERGAPRPPVDLPQYFGSWNLMSFSERQFRDVLGHFVTGITVVTCVGRDGRKVGVTINSFNSVSLEPPLVLFSVGRAGYSFDDLMACDKLAINMLAENQEELSNRFAQPGGDKWQDIDFATNDAGVPLLKGCLARLECTPEMRYEGGDHVIIVSRVDRLEARDDVGPLVYYRGSYARIAGEEY